MMMGKHKKAISCYYFIFISVFTGSCLFSQAQWVDSDGEISYIYTEDQQDSLTIAIKSLEMDLYKKTLVADNLKKDLDYCKFNMTQHSNSNYIVEQSIPIKSENKWLWLGYGSIGGFIICLLFVL